MSTALLNLLFAQIIYKQLTDLESEESAYQKDQLPQQAHNGSSLNSSPRLHHSPSPPAPEFFMKLSQDLKEHPLNSEFNLSPQACQSLYNALLPQNPTRPNGAMLKPLLGKLYESYKKDIITQIRHDEQDYRTKLREIEQIERGKWDSELLKELDLDKAQVLQQHQLKLQRQLELQKKQEQALKIQRQQLQRQQQLELQQLKQQQLKQQQFQQQRRQLQQQRLQGSVGINNDTETKSQPASQPLNRSTSQAIPTVATRSLSPEHATSPLKPSSSISVLRSKSESPQASNPLAFAIPQNSPQNNTSSSLRPDIESLASVSAPISGHATPSGPEKKTLDELTIPASHLPTDEIDGKKLNPQELADKIKESIAQETTPKDSEDVAAEPARSKSEETPEKGETTDETISEEKVDGHEPKEEKPAQDLDVDVKIQDSGQEPLRKDQDINDTVQENMVSDKTVESRPSDQKDKEENVIRDDATISTETVLPDSSEASGSGQSEENEEDLNKTKIAEIENESSTTDLNIEDDTKIQDEASTNEILSLTKNQSGSENPETSVEDKATSDTESDSVTAEQKEDIKNKSENEIEKEPDNEPGKEVESGKENTEEPPRITRSTRGSTKKQLEPPSEGNPELPEEEQEKDEVNGSESKASPKESIKEVEETDDPDEEIKRQPRTRASSRAKQKPIEPEIKETEENEEEEASDKNTLEDEKAEEDKPEEENGEEEKLKEENDDTSPVKVENEIKKEDENEDEEKGGENENENDADDEDGDEEVEDDDEPQRRSKRQGEKRESTRLKKMRKDKEADVELATRGKGRGNKIKAESEDVTSPREVASTPEVDDLPNTHDDESDEENDDDSEATSGPPTKRTRASSSAAARGSKKRKRNSSPMRSSLIPNRRFLTMVNPLLSNISSNKSASFFANPVNPNDAPNYYDLIFDPTDIRTIKAQVKDGRIKDTAELERELQRMFANAVMYNGWDSDVSVWTREMQHDTETLLALFRGAERTSAVNSSLNNDKAGSVSDDGQTETKRRKK